MTITEKVKTRHDIFIEDIVANPLDNDLKLIYADYLDDCREEELARAYRYCGEHDKEPFFLPISEGRVWYLDKQEVCSNLKRSILPLSLFTKEEIGNRYYAPYALIYSDSEPDNKTRCFKKAMEYLEFLLTRQTSQSAYKGFR